MTDLFDDFIQSEEFRLDELLKVSCYMVHPYVKDAMQEYFMEHPLETMISSLQAQIAACVASEFLHFLTMAFAEEENNNGDKIPILPLTEQDMDALIKNAVAVAFSTWNSIDAGVFDDDETANPQNRE